MKSNLDEFKKLVSCSVSSVTEEANGNAENVTVEKPNLFLQHEMNCKRLANVEKDKFEQTDEV